MRTHTHKHPRRHSPVAAFLAYFLGASLLLATATSLVYMPELHKREALLQSAQAQMVERLHEALETDMRRVTSDVMILANIEPVFRLLEADTPATRQRVAQAFMAFSGFREIYDQVRFIDNAGNELVRVNNVDGYPVAVPDAALQNQAGRYYVQHIARLPENEVYISPLDLNMEHGQVQVPYKPMIRFGTPVFDDTGTRRGMVVVNYLGERLLERLAAAEADAATGTISLLTPNGYFLKGPSEGDAWGFMLPERATRTATAVWGTDANTVLGREVGQFVGATGMFTFTTVRPAHGATWTTRAGDTGLTPGPDGYAWRLVAHVPTAVLATPAARLRAMIVKSILPLLALFAIVSWQQAIARVRRLEAEARLRDSELRFRSVAQAASDAILSADRAGVITSWNRGAQAIFGYAEAEAIGRPMQMLLPDTLRAQHADAIRRLDTDGPPESMLGRTVELAGRRKDGTAFPVEMSLARWEAGGEPCYSAIIRDATERKRMEEMLARQAATDGLTQLYNRAHFDASLAEQCARANRHGVPLTLMLIDIDHFKSVNDTHGHQAGDAALRLVAAEIAATVRGSDVAARYGGEEFAVLMPHTDLIGARTLAERLRAGVERLELPVEDGNVIHRTVSIGIARFDPLGRMSPKGLVQAADEALYQAKSSGRNRVIAADAGQVVPA